MSEVAKFFAEVAANIEGLKNDAELQEMSRAWIAKSGEHRYTYNFTWLGRPIIQLPADIMALQEIIWRTRPDLIVETGIAHGGSLIFSASMLELLGGDGMVLGIDIDIREHNRAEIDAHPLRRRITLLEGSSISAEIVAEVHRMAGSRQRTMVILDSNHTHEHVAAELALYSPLVRMGGYLVVLDTVIEDMPDGLFPDRDWGKGNNPKTAVWQFLRDNDRFRIDADLQAKLQITVAPDGYLECVKD
ncbi:MAG: cephalosporin hydroxylase family protein [Chthoniobacterales bacterium]|nr:cephalosporin hydroxylase family protein [Chthoniobacterales bacterium]